MTHIVDIESPIKLKVEQPTKRCEIFSKIDTGDVVYFEHCSFSPFVVVDKTDKHADFKLRGVGIIRYTKEHINMYGRLKMTVIDFRIEPKSYTEDGIPDDVIISRTKKALENEFGEMWEFSVLNID